MIKMLEIKEAVFGYTGKQKKKVVIENISFALEPGKLMCFLGANGAGKTTMYRTILGFIPLLGGSIFVDGRDMQDISSNQLAKYISYVPQYHTPPFAYSVYDVVLMGRGAHISPFGSPGKEDQKIACRMLERMGIFHLKDELYTEISGGERQLALIARALTQQTKYIFMDEPAASLDFGNQMRLLREIKKLTEEGIGVCFSTHQPDQAFLVNASVLALKGKNDWSLGPAEEIITEELLKCMYDVNASVHTYTGKNGKMMKYIAAGRD